MVVVSGRMPPPDFYHFRPAAMRNDTFTSTYSPVPDPLATLVCRGGEELVDFGGFQDAVQVRRLGASVAERDDCVRHRAVGVRRLNRRANLTVFGGSRIGVFGADSVLAHVPCEASSRVVARGGRRDKRVREPRHVRRVPGEIVVPERSDAASRHRRLASDGVV